MTRSVTTHRVLNGSMTDAKEALIESTGGLKKYLRKKVLKEPSSELQLLQSKAPLFNSRIEVQRLSDKVLDRKSKLYKQLKRGATGIYFKYMMFNNVRVVNDLYCTLFYTHQLCRCAFTLHELKVASNWYHKVRRKILELSSMGLFDRSRSVEHFMRWISISYRISRNYVKHTGRPRCGRPIV